MDRFFRKIVNTVKKNINEINPVFLIDSKSLKQPSGLKYTDLKEILLQDISINTNNNINIVKYENQSENPEIPPGSTKINIPLNMAIDKNYLYIWIEDEKRWKRILLSNW